MVLAQRHDVTACKAILKQGSKTFWFASLFLPRVLRDDVAPFYAFLRQADDIIDQSDDPTDALGILYRRMTCIYEGCPQPGPVDGMLWATIVRHKIPKHLFDALLDGFLWDTEKRHYETLDDTLDYAARVAGSVGVIMARLMGQSAPWVLARAAEMGCAMQLTNIARDVGEDALRGRIYLPKAWLNETALAHLKRADGPSFCASIGVAVAKLLDAADELYVRARSGIGALDGANQLAIDAAQQTYQDIGRDIRRHGYDSIGRRAHTTLWRKIWLVARAAVQRRPAATSQDLQCSPIKAVEYLLSGAPVGR